MKNKELLEYTEFNGYYYGTPKAQVDFLVSKGKNVLIEVEAQGVGPIKLNIPDGCKVIDNNSVIKVSIDLSKLSSKTITVNKFKIKNLASGHKGEVTTKNLNVEFIGSSEQLKKLSTNKITAVIDASETNGNTGSQELPVSFEIENDKTCWAYGSYLASVTIEND